MTGRIDTAAAKRLVWPTIQAVSTPPPLPPQTNRLSLVDEPFRDRGVDAGHQIVVVLAGIRILDAVDEVLPVAGAAARIGVEHRVAVRREVLEAPS